MFTALYDLIGANYDQTRKADAFLADRLASLLGVEPAGRYLDAGCGTGNYTLALARRGGDWTGVDQSARLIARARAKAPGRSWAVADLTNLPFGDATFDGIVSVLVMHHVVSPTRALASLGRVLKPGGRLVVFTPTAELVQDAWLNHYFPGPMARYAAQTPSTAALAEAWTEAGLTLIDAEPYAVLPSVEDGFLFAGKHHPERYLDPDFRAGTAVFTVLADPVEVDRGCAALARDLASGAFQEVAQRHASAVDYLFFVLTR